MYGEHLKHGQTVSANVTTSAQSLTDLGVSVAAVNSARAVYVINHSANVIIFSAGATAYPPPSLPTAVTPVATSGAEHGARIAAQEAAVISGPYNVRLLRLIASATSRVTIITLHDEAA